MSPSTRRCQWLWEANDDPIDAYCVLEFTRRGARNGWGSYIYLISTNVVSPYASRYRFEPSASVGFTWVTSYQDFSADPNNRDARGYTSSWAGSAWSSPFEHRVNGDATGDLYLMADPPQSPTRHDLTMLKLKGSGAYDPVSLVFQTSKDASGSSWNAPVVIPNVSPDYPSLAVAQNGTLVIGSNQFDGFANDYGFQSVVSTNGGATWSGPFTVISGSNTIFGRVVASGNTFYYIYVDTSAHPTYVLKCLQSSDGINWPGCAPNSVLDTYTQSASISCVDPPACLQNPVIYYAPNIDASAASGLGWVVVYAATRSDMHVNNLKFCAQALAGCTTITWGTDLFLPGITTSSNGDLWISSHTYANNTGHDLPLRLLAIYRKANGSYLSGFLQGTLPGIDPTSWKVYYYTPNCANRACYFAGDYMRLAMNTYYGGATLPFVRRYPYLPNPQNYLTDLAQNFVQDPPTRIPPVSGLQIGPVLPFGSVSTSSIPLSQAELERRPVDTHASIYYLRGGN